MSEAFKNSYFYSLPYEVLTYILSKINTVTLLNFCEIYECDYFLEDRDVVRSIDLYKAYTLPDLVELSKKIVFENVTSLNVNCLYWVSATKLRRFVAKLVNLETLYAMQTNLSLTSTDTEVFSKSKIKKLAVSVNRNDALGTHKIATIETLYLSVIKVTTLISPLVLDMIFPGLKNFWIDVEEPCGREIILHCLNAGNKNKIFCQVKAPTPSINFDHYWLSTYYNNRRASQPYVMCCEKFTAKQLRSKSIFEIERSSEESWRILDELHCSKPYGPEDARRLFLNESNVDTMFFEELNFYHNGPICNDRCRNAVSQILKSSCSSKLKKLCVMMCLFENKDAQEAVKIEDSNRLTRKRIGIMNKGVNHPMEDVFKNFQGLQHLEVFACNQTSHYSAIQAYPLITIFENLECLKVEIPVTLDGSFLIDVLQNCKHLKRLLITSLSQHEKLNMNLALAIPHATSLRDFRFQNHRIPLDKLLQRLSLINTQKLERIVLICDEIDKITLPSLQEFLDTHPQLIFLYFLIRGSTEAVIRTAQQLLNHYKKKHPSKFFLVKRIDVFNKIGFPIPNVHFCEMVKNDNHVASLNALDSFVTF
ncbi:uncharacterized protein LOC123010267 [Tribolium madens]|uniref:uncharacterized protein LOC123010267 n=1 Tax=Tribolium madens TaxID=41895 RepID=UPI001CF75883|nr:uncharacterized protein LOC123010267 [Tribolium madens]